MNNEQTILPSNATEAVKYVTKIARRLIDVMEQEGRALTMQDGVSFTAAQEDKARLSKQYQEASKEFQRRILDFRSVDKALLDKLDGVQRELKGKSEENSAVMERMQG
ncbi:MAG: hypothetical protein CO093_10205 [Alphaproteobacteria bacterium CG_4_9_14_3_um_filter_47_13]|nr:MAG: hypothetical protein CO093_10205 [Alphaproteobacteria bacterium CG_4_9_14_3_um_filter_47_13]